MAGRDQEGFYAILEVAHNASYDEIKNAYRRRAMELHPDRNSSSTATIDFQLLGLAYAVLSDPIKRASYDTEDIKVDRQNKTEAPAASPSPISCSCCGKVSAQPRYVIFYEVKSFVFFCYRSTIQGIFCTLCANKKSMAASATTWALGWWSISGFVYSIHAILINLLGGERPALANAKLLGYQAWVFGALGRAEMAQAIAKDAKKFARKIKPTSYLANNDDKLGYENGENVDLLRTQIDELIFEIGIKGPGAELKNSWALLRWPFFVHTAFLLIVLVTIWTIIQRQPGYVPRQGPKPYITSPEEQALPPIQEAYIRPKNAPNGKPWPRRSSYLCGYEQGHSDGLSEVTIDNSQNNADVFVKLISLDGANAVPTRSFFILAGEAFTLENVSAGNYDVRYRDLSNGHLSRSQQFALEEIPGNGSTQYTKLTMTLYKVRNGNLHTYALGEDEF